MDRRTFVKGAAAGIGLAAAGGTPARASIFNQLRGRTHISRRPARTPVKHLVVVMMENRSVDHMLGWYGAENASFDAHQQATFPDLRVGPTGPQVPTSDWGAAGRNSFHGRGFRDPSHGWTGGRYERAGGAANGWLDPRTGNDEFALSYYDAADVPVWAQLARQYQTYDRWHCALLGPTEPNRYYMHSGQCGGMKNNDIPPQVAAEHPEYRTGWNWPTVWDQFDYYGVTSAYYFSNLPVLAYWGARHVNQMHHISEYFAAAADGVLPQVSFIDPFFTTSEDLGNDDHPHADIRLGQQFLSDVVSAFVNSKHYRDGAMVVTYDEWGGFWDHVSPPQLPDDRATPSDPGGLEDFGQIGFRIPTSIVSPWTHASGAVDHNLYEHTSVVRFMAENWNLPYLTLRERRTNSIGKAFNKFAHADFEHAFVPYQAPASAVVDAVTSAVEATAGDPAGASPLSAPARPPLAPSGLYRLAESGWIDKLGVRTDWRLADSFS
jgi:phospholipase C